MNRATLAFLTAVCVFALATPIRADEAGDMRDAQAAIGRNDIETALGKLLPLAANASDATIKRRAHYEIGGLYEIGKGFMKDPVQAVAHYDKAADDKVPEAKLKLAMFLATGQGGTRRDPVKSVELLNQVLKAGAADKAVLANVNYQLGVLTETGSGTPQNFAAAEKLYRQAVSKEMPDSFKALALMAQKGLVTGRASWPDAYIWWSLAAAFATTESDARDLRLQREGARVSVGDAKAVACLQSIAQQIADYAKGTPAAGFKIDDPDLASAKTCVGKPTAGA